MPAKWPSTFSRFTKSSAVGASGWLPLFDGKTTKGWHSYGQRSAGAAWEVEQGALHLNIAAKEREGAQGGDLLTDAEYADFHLKLEWRIARGGNSGILFHVQEEPQKFEASWQSGPEIQLLDNKLHADAMVPKRRAGDLYDLLSGTKETVRPAGEWNLLELRFQAGLLQVYLNQEQTLRLQLWGGEWQQLVRESKFKDIPGFGTYSSGRIALQDHGDEVWFRNIAVRKL